MSDIVTILLLVCGALLVTCVATLGVLVFRLRGEVNRLNQRPLTPHSIQDQERLRSQLATLGDNYARLKYIVDNLQTRGDAYSGAPHGTGPATNERWPDGMHRPQTDHAGGQDGQMPTTAERKATQNTGVVSFGVRYAGEENDQTVVVRDDNATLFYVEIEDYLGKLKLKPELLMGPLPLNIEQTLSRLFDIERVSQAVGVEIVQPAVVRWDDGEGRGILEMRGQLRLK